MNLRILILITLLAAFSPPCPAQQTQPFHHYKITDLGDSIYPSALSNSGWVAGSFPTLPLEENAFVWRDGEIIDLGTLGNPTGSSSALGVNNLGNVVGE